MTGIHPKLSEEDVQRLFEKYGEVEKCNIMRDPHTRDSRGFGFVNMMSAHEADAAKEGLQGEVYEGRTLSIERARRSKPRHPTPGKYFGPPKRGKFICPMQSLRKSADRRTEDFGGRRPPPRGGFGGDRYGGGGYRGYGRRDEPYGGRGRDRDDRYASSYPPRRDRYDERPPRDDRYSSRGGGGRDYDSRGPPPPAGGRYEGGGGGGYDDRADDRYPRR